MDNLKDKDVEGKNVVLRTDLNLPIENGEPQPTVRFQRYVETIKELSDRGAKTLVVAHQGRPARKDFLSLEKHSKLLEDQLKKDVDFVQSFFGSELGESIASMDEGDVTLLENIRFLSEELQNASPRQHSKDYFIQNMSRYFDLYIDDAFSAAHRSHGSMVGFTETLDSCAGPVMKKELESCGKVRDRFDGGVLVLGGEKPSDILGMLDHMIEEAEKVLLGGIPGELALMIEGYELGKKSDWIKENGFDSGREEMKELLENYGEKVEVPKDLRTESGNYSPEDVPEDEMTWDIGKETVERYTGIVEESDSAVMKGPMGAFDQGHEEGSKRLVDKLASTEAFTVIGGGHTSSLVQRFGHNLDDFSHVSIAGGAFVRYMSGEELAAVEALKQS